MSSYSLPYFLTNFLKDLCDCKLLRAAADSEMHENVAGNLGVDVMTLTLVFQKLGHGATHETEPGLLLWKDLLLDSVLVSLDRDFLLHLLFIAAVPGISSVGKVIVVATSNEIPSVRKVVVIIAPQWQVAMRLVVVVIAPERQIMMWSVVMVSSADGAIVVGKVVVIISSEW